MTNGANPRETMPTYYLAHGGGPCFFMEWPGDPHAWDALASFLRGVRGTLPARPSAIVVVSAHWEAGRPTVTATATPELIYDYSGFPAHTYQLPLRRARLAGHSRACPSIARRGRDRLRRGRAARVRSRRVRPVQADRTRGVRCRSCNCRSCAASIPRNTSRSGARSRR